jgi:protease-4
MERKAGMRNALRSALKAADLALRILLPLLAGYLLALVLVPTPKIAVIRVEGEIWGSYTADISRALEQVGRDRAVRAVVLDVSSPGGEVSASEGLYFDLLKLREIKPVVVSVDEMAASGAYYIACAADRIYAKPASMVGNIGVISILGDEDLVDEVLITTGPFKLSGGSQDAYIRQMELLKQTFLAAIMAQRQARLQVGPDVLARGEIYLGLQAQQMGLIDAIGSQAEATAEAARLARVRHYQVVDRTPESALESLMSVDETGGRSTAATVADLPHGLLPGCYYRYVEPLP